VNYCADSAKISGFVNYARWVDDKIVYEDAGGPLGQSRIKAIQRYERMLCVKQR